LRPAWDHAPLSRHRLSHRHGACACDDPQREDGDLPLIAFSDDVRAGDWLIRALAGFGTGLGSIVPDGFAAYARVLHPAWRGRAKVRWRDLATGPLDAGTRFETPAAEGVQAPFTGTLDCGDLRAVLDALAPETAGECWFGVWAGFGWVPDPPPAPRLDLQERPLLLYRGPLAAATALCEPYEQTPTLWWPDDRAWCVASEVDFHSTYVGGPRSLIDRLLRDDRIEAVEVAVTDRVTD
jgi:hypothetical protein